MAFAERGERRRDGLATPRFGRGRLELRVRIDQRGEFVLAANGEVDGRKFCGLHDDVGHEVTLAKVGDRVNVPPSRNEVTERRSAHGALAECLVGLGVEAADDRAVVGAPGGGAPGVEEVEGVAIGFVAEGDEAVEGDVDAGLPGSAGEFLLFFGEFGGRRLTLVQRAMQCEVDQERLTGGVARHFAPLDEQLLRELDRVLRIALVDRSA